MLGELFEAVPDPRNGEERARQTKKQVAETDDLLGGLLPPPSWGPKGDRRAKARNTEETANQPIGMVGRPLLDKKHPAPQAPKWKTSDQNSSP